MFMGISLFVWFVRISYEKQKAKASLEIQNQINLLSTKIHEEVHSSAEVLYSISNLITTFNELDGKQFERFTSDLSVRKKGILLVEWQPRVPAEQREKFVNQVRKNGIQDFELLEPNENNELIKAKSREEHFPVLYAVSTRGQEKSIGLDLAWSRERMSSKYLARDLGVIRASNTFKVMFTSGTQSLLSGFALTLPVYDSEEIPTNLKNRREKLMGFLAAVIYLDELLSPLMKELNAEGLYSQIKDLGTNSLITTTREGNGAFSKSKTIDVYGQKWEIKVYPSSKFLESYLSIKHFLAPLFLILFLLALFYSFLRNEKKNNELIKIRFELEEALEGARIAAKSKMIFLANMSHEIRTPMNAILGYGKLLESEDNKELKTQYVERMKSSGGHLLNLIDDILEVSSLEEGNIKLRPHKFDLQDVISDVSDIVTKRINNPDVEYQCERVSDSKGYSLFGDSVRLRQILLNLLGNACKFTEAGLITLKYSVESMGASEDIIVHFEVIDTGVGMDESYLGQAYFPFSQEDETFSRKKGGVGLGLSIVNSIVNLMNGTISVRTKKGQGTAFKVVLPFKEASAISVENKNILDGSIQSNYLGQRKSLIVAEDDQDSRFLISNFLLEENIDLEFVNNGNELLEKVFGNSYDLILTDIQMPELDGLSATQILRGKGISTPILALSAHALKEEIDKALSAGVDDVLSKPFNKESLVSFLNKYLINA